jgi:hypothetical protein
MKFNFCWITGALLLSTSVYADGDSARMLSVGGGIASPSKTSALVENPAGLSLNETTRILGVLGSGDDSFSPVDYGGGAFFGNGSVGAAGEIERVGGATTDLDLGMGVLIPGIDMSFGAAVQHDLSGGGNGWTTNLGAILNTKGKWRIGAEVQNVFNGPGGYGAGFATDLSPDATFATDASVDQNFHGLHVKPALQVDVKVFQLVFGYGIEVDHNSTSFINTGFAAGLGFKLTQTAYFQGYYNQLDKYYFGVTFRL